MSDKMLLVEFDGTETKITKQQAMVIAEKAGLLVINHEDGTISMVNPKSIASIKELGRFT